MRRKFKMCCYIVIFSEKRALVMDRKFEKTKLFSAVFTKKSKNYMHMYVPLLRLTWF